MWKSPWKSSNPNFSFRRKVEVTWAAIYSQRVADFRLESNKYPWTPAPLLSCHLTLEQFF